MSRAFRSRMAAVAMATAIFGGSQAQGQLQPGFGGRIVDLAIVPTDTQRAVNILDFFPSIPQNQIEADVTGLIPVADFGGNNAGLFAGNQPYPGFPFNSTGQSVPGLGTNFVVELEANVTIPAGTWQIFFGTDEGGMVQIPGVSFVNTINEDGPVPFLAAGDDTIWFDQPRSFGWTGGEFTVTGQPLETTFRHVFYENTGNDLSEIVIRSGSGEPAPTSATAANWTLLQNGALGWSVTTDAVPGVNIAGQGRTGTQTLEATLSPTEVDALGSPVPGAFMQVFRGSQANLGTNTRAGWDAFLARFPEPWAEGIESEILWASPDRRTALPIEGYPETILSAFNSTDNSANRDNYAVRVTGEINIPANGPIRFKDNVDEYVSFQVDLNGDGVLEASEYLIDDNTRTGENGVLADGTSGSPIATGNFTNVAAGGAWRKYEYRMAESSGSDSAGLFWDQATSALFPSSNNAPLTLDALVETQDLRTFMQKVTAAELGGTFAGGVFEVNVADANWDRIAMPAATAAEIEAVNLSIEGANFKVQVLDPQNLTPGFTVDLIANEGLTELSGTPTITFVNTNSAQWDTSTFAVNGQLTWQASTPGIIGDYNASGRVEQADLDLVLLNWGQPGVPGGWVHDLPEGTIDQAELDGVLLNWGNEATLGNSSDVPEPRSALLLLAGTVLVRGFFRKW